MDAKKLKAIIMMGESTTVQFKERVDDSYKIGCEFVAFSNSQGGLLVVGVMIRREKSQACPTRRSKRHRTYCQMPRQTMSAPR